MRAPLGGTLYVSQLFGGGVKYGEAYTTWIGGKQVRVRGHTGLDFSTAAGTPVYAVWPGTVYNGWDPYGFANYIKLHVADGRSALFAHLSAFAQKNDTLVGPGELIGYSGNTGHSTGPHLHFEVRPGNPDYQNGYAGCVDPIQSFDHDVIDNLNLDWV